MDMTIRLAGGKKVEAAFGEFTVKTDQPAEAGGSGSAPTPFDLFLASIGTCAGLYVGNFCSERGISLDQLAITLRTARSSGGSMIDRITLEISLPPEFPEKYKDTVIKVANLCAVKKHIMNPPVFEITTV